MHPPYSDIQDPLILRDHLALDRTTLAVERTLLAYLRTALALLVGGVSAMHFLHEPLWQVAGLSLVVVAVGLTVWGVGRCVRVFRLLRYVRQQPGAQTIPKIPPEPQ